MQHATCQSKSLSLHTLQEFEAKDLDLDDLEDWMNSSVADGLSPPSVRVEKDGREGTNLILTIYMYIYIYCFCLVGLLYTCGCCYLHFCNNTSR